MRRRISDFPRIEGYIRISEDELKADLKAGNTLYRQFNQFEPSSTTRVQHLRLMPPIVVDLGELVGLIYRSDKWQPGHPRSYIHRLQTPPRLVCNVEGTQLYIVGGNYHITDRGIEG